ncbi:hypothetical protein DFJ58DRAFT_837226 [Suillus subalutaceus]|uniref:uncharacterized protein n=1 Tax=Suillus subalutaceus TaxID=48586 RepID=UPI001B87FC79|nr:uncharacterized protein DFJ58DRAFT_837226 [Suillus subalutaceus]KAG1871256.1 hypothetical protein DFJ58DRAFT_837226 [Suillus subalutaceus]
MWLLDGGIRTSVNDLVKTYESSKIQESKSAIASPQVMVIWRVVPFSVQQGRCGQGWQVIVIVISALLSLPLLISLLLHPNRHVLAIRAHVPKTIHPWVAPLENPASEVALWLWLLLVVVMQKGCRSQVVENADESKNKIKLGSLHKVDSAHRIFDLLAPSWVTGPSHLLSQTLVNLAHGCVQTGRLQPMRHAEAVHRPQCCQYCHACTSIWCEKRAWLVFKCQR